MARPLHWPARLAPIMAQQFAAGNALSARLRAERQRRRLPERPCPGHAPDRSTPTPASHRRDERHRDRTAAFLAGPRRYRGTHQRFRSAYRLRCASLSEDRRVPPLPGSASRPRFELAHFGTGAELIPCVAPWRPRGRGTTTLDFIDCCTKPATPRCRLAAPRRSFDAGGHGAGTAVGASSARSVTDESAGDASGPAGARAVRIKPGRAPGLSGAQLHRRPAAAS